MNNNNEFFTDVIYEDIAPNTYAISNYGRIMNKNTGHVLSTHFNDNGYIMVNCLNMSGTYKPYRLHRIVATAFVPKTEEDIILGRDTVNHKDRNKANPCAYNLEWVTQAENLEHARNTTTLRNPIGMFKSQKQFGAVGVNNTNSILTEDQVIRICELLEVGEFSHKDILMIIGLEVNTNNLHLISNISTGNNWTHISSKYNIVNKQRDRISEQDVVKICEMLQNTDLSYNDILINIGLSKEDRYIIYNIVYGYAWQHIACNYTFRPRNGKCKITEEQVVEICKLLENKSELGMTYRDIAKTVTGDSSNGQLVYNIASGKAWSRISKNYKI